MESPVNIGFDLRDYQLEFLERTRALYESGLNRQLCVAATGTGKTVMLCGLPGAFPELAENKMLVLVHRHELVTQAVEKLYRTNPRMRIGVEKAEFRTNAMADVVVASVQTLGRSGSSRIRKFPAFGIIVVDEAHHAIPGSQYDNVLNHFYVGSKWAKGSKYLLPTTGKPPLLVGMTATPNRHDKTGLHHMFDEISVNYDILFGVREGWLVDIEGYSVDTGSDISDVATRAGDFSLDQLAGAVNIEERNALVVSGFKQHGGRKALAFCVNISHAHSLAEAFQSVGVKAIAVDMDTSSGERANAVRRFRHGDIEVLCNCGIFTEGFDAPECDTILMARPTKSAPLYVQMIGRGTRPSVDVNYDTVAMRKHVIATSDKPAMKVIDFVDNTGRHKIITAPTLFGLQPKFKLKGRKLIQEIVETVERLEKENPDKPIRTALSIEEVETIARKVSLLDTVLGGQELRDATEYRWFDFGDHYQIQVPSSQGTFFVGVEQDAIGAWRISKRDKTGKTIANHKFETWAEAIAACDRKFGSEYVDVANLMLREPKWGGAKATDKQKAFMKRLGVSFDENTTKGDAAAKIDLALSKKSRAN